MTFQELYDEVILLTKRPDLIARTEQAIRAATLKAHHSDFYYPDIYEVPVTFTAPFYLQSFVPTEIVPRFRKPKYIRLWQGENQGAPGKFLTPIQIENSVDGYGYIKNDVYYMAGQNLQIRMSQPFVHVLFGCYLHPTITPKESYTSWIAVEMPYAIIYEAVRTIFKSISYLEQANEFAQMVAEQFQELKLSYVDDVPLT